jgi:hypothetical protein
MWGQETMNRYLPWIVCGASLAAAFCFAAAWAGQARADDAPGTALQVANGGKRPIVAVYTSPPGRGDWSDDMLGKGTLKPGQSQKLKLKAKPDGCKVDVSALMDNGDTATRKDVDLCASAPSVGF